MSHQHIAFSDMTQEERQLFIDFQMWPAAILAGYWVIQVLKGLGVN